MGTSKTSGMDHSYLLLKESLENSITSNNVYSGNGVGHCQYLQKNLVADKLKEFIAPQADIRPIYAEDKQKKQESNTQNHESENRIDSDLQTTSNNSGHDFLHNVFMNSRTKLKNQYVRSYRASLTEEERERRKEYQRNYNATVRKEKFEMKRDHLNAYQRNYRSMLSEEEKERRKAYQRTYNATVRKEKNAVKREHLNAYQRKYRASLSEERRQKRREYQRIYKTSLSEEVRCRRKEYHRNYNATVRSLKFKFEMVEGEPLQGEEKYHGMPHFNNKDQIRKNCLAEESSDERNNCVVMYRDMLNEYEKNTIYIQDHKDGESDFHIQENKDFEQSDPLEFQLNVEKNIEKYNKDLSNNLLNECIKEEVKPNDIEDISKKHLLDNLNIPFNDSWTKSIKQEY